MPKEQRELLEQYGAVALAGNASLFVGAGLSQAAGYPGWVGLLEPLRNEANLPELKHDSPLLAQYFVDSKPGGQEVLESYILEQMLSVKAAPAGGHRFLAQLPVADIWTTNYDTLLEQAMPGIRVVAAEKDIVERRRPTKRRLTKMHGSLKLDKPEWLASPVITRSSYESYEHDYPRIWALLRSTYLTRTFLFLGFSFLDPNIEILLRLSRSLFDRGAPEHFTVLKRPTEPDEKRLHELRVRDLEKSGVAVCEIEDHAELVPLLESLVRRTREPRLFVSGSNPTDGSPPVRDMGKRLAHRLADFDIKIQSLAGDAGLAVSFPFGFAREAHGRYDPSEIVFYFRKEASGKRPVTLQKRVGTAVYTAKDREDILDEVLPEVRALVVIGGGTRTGEELGRAQALRIPIIPLPTSGGAAKEIYRIYSFDDLTQMEPTAELMRLWDNLMSIDEDIVVDAVHKLIQSAMYLKYSSSCHTLKI
jgi:hypothetical protein